LLLTTLLIACGGGSGGGTETVQPATVPTGAVDSGSDGNTTGSSSGDGTDSGIATDTGGTTGTGGTTDSGGTTDGGSATDSGETTDGEGTIGDGDTSNSADPASNLFSDLVAGDTVFTRNTRNDLDGLTIVTNNTYSETDRILTGTSIWTPDNRDQFQTTNRRHYNDAGELVREEFIENGTALIDTVFRYEDGLLLNVMSDFFVDGTVDSVTDLEYDQLGRLISSNSTNAITGAAQTEATRVYSDSGWTTQNTSLLANTVTTTVVTTDNSGKVVTAVRTFNDGSQSSSSTSTFNYDDNGTLLMVEQINAAGELASSTVNSNIFQIGNIIHEINQWSATFSLGSL